VISAALLAAVGVAVALSSADTSGTTGRHVRPSVVLISFDEFSTTSLLDRHGHVDATRYPNFAAFARDATWFPNATASVDQTGRAMEALLSGRLPPKGVRATPRGLPHTLFTLLGGRYRIDASEEATSLCPRRLCPHALPYEHSAVLHRLASGRPERFERWLRTVRPGARPALFFKHVMLPHGPWRYLPSGRNYGRNAHEPIAGITHAFTSRWPQMQKYQRHLLQLGFSDRLLGHALARLRQTGLYDSSLIVVTADNGESFGRLSNGHEIDGGNFGDIALTPLFIKAPFQRRGRVVRQHVRTLDVLPTIAHVLHVRVPWRTQGHSVFGRAARHIPAMTTLYQRSGRRFTLGYRGLRAWQRNALRLKHGLFGTSSAWSRLYRIGPYRQLLGTPVLHWAVSPVGAARAVLDRRAAFASVHLRSGFLPSYVSGRIRNAGFPGPRAIAIALNDRVVATAPTFRLVPGGPLFISAMAPEGAFREGRNRIEVFAVSRTHTGPRLKALGPTG
jgi:Sulfatase